MDKKGNFFRSLILLVVAAGLGGIISVSLFDYLRAENQPMENYPKAQSYNVNTITIPNFDFAEVSEMVTPTVVHITTKISKSPTSNNPFEFFEYNMPRVGSGSGVLVSSNGYIVTNNHVVKGAEEIQVVLADKRNYSGQVIGTDPSTDLALVKISEDNLPYVNYGNSDNVRVGEWVLAVGNPFNLTSTVTAGIVSAKGRNINLLGGGANIESFIQTDAAVNPGNSGGALVNVKGELVGINTAIASRTGQYAGYSFAVPTNIVKKVVSDLIEYGEVQRGFIGVSIASVTGEIARENDLDKVSGVYVMDAMANSAASEAGIKKGDVITHVDDREVATVPELQELIGLKRPGDVVRLTVLRDGKSKDYDVILRDQEGNAQLVSKKLDDFRELLGAELEVINNHEKEKYNIGNGLKIKEIDRGVLEKAGVPEGFIITRVNKKPVFTKHDLYRELNNEDGGVLIEGINPDGSKGYYGFGID